MAVSLAMYLQQSHLSSVYECVPNFSCSHGDEIFPELCTVAEATGVTVLDVHSDRSYNRTVLTYMGSPKTSVKACFNLIEVATRCIDMTQHRGAHPRIGAVDVFPFVPMPGTSVAQCIEQVKSLAQSVAEDLNLCVYLYGQAAIRPERRKLANIRRGEFEGWYQEIGHEPTREPDFGPPVAKSCGPVILGVRKILIAINYVLKNGDIELARRIAKSIRSEKTGLPNLQARGFLIGGRPQVSCNFLDYATTGPRQAFEHINQLCQINGAAIQETEIVGMIPKEAMNQEDRIEMMVKDWQDTKYLDPSPSWLVQTGNKKPSVSQ